MSGPTHGGKGDDRRPETIPGAYAHGFDAIDWTARDRDAVAHRDVPDIPAGDSP